VSWEDDDEPELAPFMVIERRDRETNTLIDTITGLKDESGSVMGVMVDENDEMFPEVVILPAETWVSLLGTFLED